MEHKRPASEGRASEIQVVKEEVHRKLPASVEGLKMEVS
jgi:hypothetical protein